MMTKKKDIKTIIANLSKDELINIILDITKENKEIENRLLFQYASGQDEIRSSKKLIREYINKAKRHGFIEWGNVNNALLGAEITLEKAYKKIENGAMESAVLLSITVLSIVVDMLQYCDDSSGYVGGVIEESLEIIDEAVSSNINKLNDRQKIEIFDIVMKEALNDRYDGWNEWRIRLLEICIVFCGNPDLRNKLEKQIQKLLGNVSRDSWISKYSIENLKLLQLQMIERYDKEEKALQFIYNHIQLSPFREKAIQHLIEKGELLQVVNLCKEGEENDQEYRGLVHKWKKYRLDTYEKLGDFTKQKELMLEFLYGNEYEYYLKLKKLYEPTEWRNVLKEIIDTFEKQPYPPSGYVEILKTEKMYDKLLNYCQTHKSAIENLYPYIIDVYFEEVNELFGEWIEMEADQSSNRKQYRNVCKMIKTYKKACGDIHAQKLIEGFKQTYKRRPAFIDELKKLK